MIARRVPPILVPMTAISSPLITVFCPTTKENLLASNCEPLWSGAASLYSQPAYCTVTSLPASLPVLLPL
jgi:hypothetical protein